MFVDERTCCVSFVCFPHFSFFKIQKVNLAIIYIQQCAEVVWLFAPFIEPGVRTVSTGLYQLCRALRKHSESGVDKIT